MTTKYWKPYSPTLMLPWNAARATHLHSRLGFAATPEELERDLDDGYSKSMARMLSHSDAPLDHRAEMLVQQSIDTNQIRRLKAAWVMQMWHGSDPLTEQISLMWHNHFATSFLKVKDCDAMWQQNQLFRQLGRGNFGLLLEAILRDRATLVWLDATSNRAQHPNENLARELLELFTLGVGNYTETDVREVARSLTGWRVDNSGVHFEAESHDNGIKNILGQTVNHDLKSVAGLLANHPATSRRLAWRICQHFLGAVVTDIGIQELASLLQEQEMNFELAVKMVVQSERLFADSEIRQRVRSPVSLVVGGIRSLHLHQSHNDQTGVSPEVAADWMAAMGQDLFQPPGVAGWQGGVVWLNTSTMIQRAAFAKALSEGQLGASSQQHSGAAALAFAFNQID